MSNLRRSSRGRYPRSHFCVLAFRVPCGAPQAAWNGSSFYFEYFFKSYAKGRIAELEASPFLPEPLSPFAHHCDRRFEIETRRPDHVPLCHHSEPLFDAPLAAHSPTQYRTHSHSETVQVG